MFIDIHLHTVRKKSLPRDEKGDNYASPEELIEMMDRTGVDKGILMPGVSPECRKQFSTVEDIMDVCEKYPDRFIPFCNIDPRAEKETPWKLMVLGYQADVLKKNVYKQLDREKRREYKAQKSGKVADPRPISESVDEGYASIAACIVGWTGTDNEYTPALALNIITNNESVREQVKKFSDDLGNFGNSK